MGYQVLTLSERRPSFSKREIVLLCGNTVIIRSSDFRQEVYYCDLVLSRIMQNMEMRSRFRGDNNSSLTFLHLSELFSSPPPGFHFSSLGFNLAGKSSRDVTLQADTT